MEADVIAFEEHSSKMEATDLEANPEETEAAVELQELFKKERSVQHLQQVARLIS
jgi:hypothetical protein